MNEENNLGCIANDLLRRAEIINQLPRMAENDEYNDILLNIKAEELIEIEDYVNR